MFRKAAGPGALSLPSATPPPRLGEARSSLARDSPCWGGGEAGRAATESSSSSPPAARPASQEKALILPPSSDQSGPARARARASNSAARLRARAGWGRTRLARKSTAGRGGGGCSGGQAESRCPEEGAQGEQGEGARSAQRLREGAARWRGAREASGLLLRCARPPFFRRRALPSLPGSGRSRRRRRRGDHFSPSPICWPRSGARPASASASARRVPDVARLLCSARRPQAGWLAGWLSSSRPPSAAGPRPRAAPPLGLALPHPARERALPRPPLQCRGNPRGRRARQLRLAGSPRPPRTRAQPPLPPPPAASCSWVLEAPARGRRKPLEPWVGGRGSAPFRAGRTMRFRRRLTSWVNLCSPSREWLGTRAANGWEPIDRSTVLIYRSSTQLTMRLTGT